MGSGHDIDAAMAMRRSNRRRLLVFIGTFLLILLPGLLWNFMRPAEYRASARLEIKPGTVAPRNDGAPAALVIEGQSGQKIDLLTQAQLLTSRNLLDTVVQRMSAEGLASPYPGDPVAALHATAGLQVAGQSLGLVEQLCKAQAAAVEADRRT